MSYPPLRYDAEAGAVSAVFRPGETPQDLVIGVRSKVGYLATGATTDGQFQLGPQEWTELWARHDQYEAR